MRRHRRVRGRDAQLGRWVCDGLVPMPLLTRLAREVACAGTFDALHSALARIEHAFIECRIDHDQVAALRQQHRRRFYALVDAAIMTREDPRSIASEVDPGRTRLRDGLGQEPARASGGKDYARTQVLYKNPLDIATQVRS